MTHITLFLTINVYFTVKNPFFLFVLSHVSSNTTSPNIVGTDASSNLKCLGGPSPTVPPMSWPMPTLHAHTAARLRNKPLSDLAYYLICGICYNLAYRPQLNNLSGATQHWWISWCLVAFSYRVTF